MALKLPQDLNYNCEELIAVLQNGKTQTSEIVCILQNMEGHISALTSDFQALVKVIMNLDWLNRGSEFVEVYKSFVLNLLSANLFYLKPFLRHLVKLFSQESNTENAANGETKISKIEQDFQEIHSLLRSLCCIVPMTTVVIFPILEEKFPYMNKGVTIFEKYTQNILVISTYIPTIRRDILDLVVRQMLKLDVRSSREEIHSALKEDTNKDEEDDEDIFEMDVSEAKDTKKETTTEVLRKQLASRNAVAGALDVMMHLTLKYIHGTCHPKGKLNWEATKTLYRELLSSFQKFNLPSHSANHVQFILFYICSFKEELAVGFIDYLWKKVTDPNTQAIYRQIGACYIGSFLTRAAYVSDKTTREVLELMMKWLHKYLDQNSDQNSHADLVHHLAFYGVCQACFYIFCFKHNQLLQRKKDHKWAESLNFQRLVTCKLNPLKICQPIIVQTFSSAARTHQVAFCDTVIERNNRYSLPVSSQSLQKLRETKLDLYFPFDPYLLPGSSTYINPLYKEFQGSVSEDDKEENEDEDDFLPDDEICSASVPSDSKSIPGQYSMSPMDFLHHGTSPGFQHNT